MSGWADYGFPNPELQPLLTPVTGIIEALNERRSAVGLSAMQIPERFSRVPSISRNFMIEFEQILKNTATYYINPDKYDPSTLEHIDQMLWSYSDLRDAAAGGYANRVEPSDPYPRFFPEWPAAWLKQVKKMIDLMRYPVIQADYLLKFGDAYYKSSKIDAYNSAINNLHVIGYNNWLISSMLCNPQGNNSWSIQVHQLDYIHQSLPAGVTDAWLVAYVDWGRGFFDDFGTGLVKGFNRIKAENGYYIKRSDPIPYPQEWDNSREYYGGFEGFASRNHSTNIEHPIHYADYYPIFNFKEESTA